MREVDPWDLAETVREGLLVLDFDLTIRFANRSFCTHLHRARGFRRPEALQARQRTVGHPNSAPRSRLSFLAESHIEVLRK